MQTSWMWMAVACGLLHGCATGDDAPAADEQPTVLNGRIRLPGTTIDLEPVSVVRGTTALDLAIVGTSTPIAGTVVTEHSGFAETVQTMASEIEQSWTFDHAPSGTGDLVIAVSAAGLSFVGTDGVGLIFQESDKTGVSYSHGTWIDGAGHTTSVPATYSGGQIVLRVPAATLDRSTFPAVLDPKIKPTPPIEP